MLGSIVQRIEWPLVRRALYECSPFTILHNLVCDVKDVILGEDPGLGGEITYISTLAWERLGSPPSELVNVAREREVWGPLLELLPPRPDPGLSR